MGCTQSKIENDETVIRCKERKQLMNEAVSSRNAFAAAHSAYAMYVKNTGAALSDYAEGEVEFSSSSDPSAAVGATLPAVPQSYESFAPPPPPNFTPPPPPPNFTPPPLQRAATMPEISIPKSDMKHSDAIIEEEEEDEDEIEIENENHSLRHRSTRSSGGSRNGISSREVEDEGFPRPSSPPRTPPQSNRAPPPPPPPPQEGKWDFFTIFPDMENVTGPTLADVDESAIEKEEIARKVYEERSKRDEIDARRSREAEAEAEAQIVERRAELPPQPPAAAKPMKKARQVQVAPAEGKREAKGGTTVDFLKIFSNLDDCFLKASQSAHEVSKMLEATRLHYHSNFADNRGHIDHSARVMRVITWNRSFRGPLNTDDGKDEFDSEENETHAAVLDKMLAWEKKLCEEVKAGEQMKLEYQRKVASLTKLKKRGTNTEALERIKAAVSHLHTRYIVDMQSMDSTVSEINRLRDEQLYPKLVALVDEMATMWETMQTHHESQSKIVRVFRSLDIPHSSKETSEHHHERTVQLFSVVREWHSQFEKLMRHQKEYIKALNKWLRLNLIPIDNNLKERVSSPQRPQNPLIQALLLAWNDYLEKLPEELARTAIQNFAAVVDSIVQYQEEEIKMMGRCKETQNELDRKTKQFNKYMQRKMPSNEMDPERAQDIKDDLAIERQLAVEMLKNRLEEEIKAHRKQCVQVREKSLTTLKSRLPELFRAMSEYSLACSDMYRNLKSISDPHNSNE